MNCKQFEKLLDLYLDGEMDKKSAEEMHAHIAGCSNCAREFAAYEKIKNGFSLIADEPMPIGFEQRWKQAVLKAPEQRKKKPVVKLLPALATCAVAIAVIGTVLATGVLHHPVPNTVSVRSATAQAAKGGAALGAGHPGSASLDQNTETGSVMMAPAPVPTVPSAAPEAESASFAAASEASAAPAASLAAAEPPQMKMSVQDSVTPITVEMTTDSLDKLENAFASFESVKIEYERNKNHLNVTVTDENQKALTSIAESFGLDIKPQTGEIYDFFSAQ